MVQWSACSDGTNYELSCANTPPSTATLCSCRENGVTVGAFTHDGLLCTLPGGAIDEPANTGCDWDFRSE